MFHSVVTGSAMHVVQAFTYANATARLAASGFQSTDIGKVAYQTDTQQFFILCNTTPLWEQISSAASGSTNGAIEYFSTATNTLTSLPIGSTSQVLTVVGGIPTWTTGGFSNQSANTIFAGPTSGSAAAPTFRALTGADLPFNQNLLINGGFDFFQRGTSISTSSSNVYIADRWFTVNGTGGTLNFSQGAPAATVPGVGLAMNFTYGAGCSNPNMNISQVVENKTSMLALDSKVSFGVWVQGVAAVTQVTIAVTYANTETKTQTVITSAAFTITNGSYTYCTLNNVSIPGSINSSGSIGVQIYPTTASNTLYTSGNGLTIAGAMLNIGSTAAPFQKAGGNYSGELIACQRFYEKSFNIGVTPAANISGTAQLISGFYFSTSAAVSSSVMFKTTKRQPPTITAYDPNSSNVGDWSYYNLTGGVSNSEPVTPSATITSFNVTASGLSTSSIGSNILFSGNWTADAEI